MHEQIRLYLHKPWMVPTSVGIVSFAAGIGVGYILTRRKYVPLVLETELEIPPVTDSNQLTLDFENAGRTLLAKYKNVVVEEEYDFEHQQIEREMRDIVSTPRLDDRSIVINPRRDPKDIVLETNESVITNIFAGNNDEWDYEAELSTRSGDKPYILHRDEFFADELGYGQATLTYYEGDDILVDEREVPIHNHKAVVGENLLFGHGSGDVNVVYIRNERLAGDYEVLRDTSSYEVEVLGLEVERQHSSEDLRHSKHTAIRFRPE